MFDPLKLIDAMPFSDMEPECIAHFDAVQGSDVPGLCEERPWWVPSLTLLESPTCERRAYLLPRDWIQTLCFREGMTREDLKSEADRWCSQARASLPGRLWTPYFDWCSPSQEHAVSAGPFLDWMGRVGLISPHLLDFIQAGMQESLRAACFQSFDGEQAMRWSVADRPDRPPPHMMVQFSPGAAWVIEEDWCDLRSPDNLSNPFLTWRDSIRELAARIEAETGEPPYDFCDLQSEYGDDFIHRFLVLHWLCTFRPQDPYVQHLCRASGAGDLYEFMSALVDPKSYNVPYLNLGFYSSCEVSSARFTVQGPSRAR